MASRPKHEVVINPSWLLANPEPVLEPSLPIIDAHHHMWMRAGGYLLQEYLADVEAGHNVLASVHVQCATMYRADGPEHLRPIGETEFINGLASMSASGAYGSTRVCSAIVGFADLLLGHRVGDVLEAHLRSGGDRFRGIRFSTNWEPHESFREFVVLDRGDVMEDRSFQDGFAVLSSYGLSFDAWVYHHQIPQVASLASKFPDTTIILNHLGGPLGYGPYAARQCDVFQAWRNSISELVPLENVFIKIGGLGMPISGFNFSQRREPPSSLELADVYQPFFSACMSLIGPRRCMFESNFPADKASYSYVTLWNAFKRLSRDLSKAERNELFFATAKRAYRLNGVVCRDSNR